MPVSETDQHLSTAEVDKHEGVGKVPTEGRPDRFAEKVAGPLSTDNALRAHAWNDLQIVSTAGVRFFGVFTNF